MGAWYKSFYLMTVEGEKELRDAIADTDNRADVQKRLTELRSLPKDRCVISDTQREYLERILA